MESPAALFCCCSLLLYTSHVCVGSYDGKVYVIERLTGVVKWSYQTGGPVKSSACVNPRNGYAYIGSHDHHLYAFSIQVTIPKNHLLTYLIFVVNFFKLYS